MKTLKPTQSLKGSSSWVIVDKLTRNAIFETFQKSVTEKINTNRYVAVPIMDYLCNLNEEIKGGK